MSDLIDRQAAIDALGERPMVWVKSDYELGARNQYDADVLALETVPSAQPEQRWIPCSERLPEKNCRCLTTNTAWGAFEVDWNVWINGEWLYQNEKPIAWMPMPEPYKEDDHDNTR